MRTIYRSFDLAASRFCFFFDGGATNAESVPLLLAVLLVVDSGFVGASLRSKAEELFSSKLFVKFFRLMLLSGIGERDLVRVRERERFRDLRCGERDLDGDFFWCHERFRFGFNV